jgi:hypothetical protein
MLHSGFTVYFLLWAVFLYHARTGLISPNSPETRDAHHVSGPRKRSKPRVILFAVTEFLGTGSQVLLLLVIDDI